MAAAALVSPRPKPISAPRVQVSTQHWRLIVCVFLPFAAAYYLSHLFRTINALISGQLTSELALGAAELGLLTAAFFLIFGAAQIPIGVLLDRYGPRRVQSVLLLVAAAGAALFGASEGFGSLVIARAMIGFGVAAALMAALKAVVLWFPKERVALVNGCMSMCGALGAVTATAPAERLLDWIGWRGLFELLAAVTAGSAVLIYFLVPEPVSAASPPKSSTSVSLKTVYADSRFWRLAPLSATCAGSAWSLQGLWAAPWLTDVERLDRASVVTHLFVMAVALSVGALLLGTIADRMRRRGVGPQGLLAIAAALVITAQLALILRLPLPTFLPWSVVAIFGSAAVLGYAVLAEYFPKELAGRANSALSVLHFGWAFVIQCATGLVVEQWPNPDGHYPAIAYQVAFGFNVAFQIGALVWFALPQLRPLCSRVALRCLNAAASDGTTLDSGTPYEKAIQAWAERLVSARREGRNWRFVALGSTSLSMMLGLAFAISASRTEVLPYILEVDRLNASRPASPASSALSDAQIAYFLARFVKNVRSLPSDPIVVRANWMDALNFVTDRGAQALNDYARSAKPFMQIGSRPVTVDVLYVVRASESSFEVRWKEHTYETGAIVTSEHFTGIAEIIVKPVNIAETLRNPLGLYVHAFIWSRDSPK
jgi:type IV secretory pathway TrbF-like protein/sugar phosphate permease